MATKTQSSDVAKIFISAYGPKLKVPLKFTGQGRTKQSHKDECDINQILARYRRTGVLDFAAKNEPQYGDVTGADFQLAQNMVVHAKQLFAQIPAHVRERFNNDPGRFLNFVQDPDNDAEAIKLGLKVKPEAPQAPEVNPTAPTAPTPTPGAVKTA